jgi:hypothetical protein
MPEEMQSRREAGPCFNCDEKFTPGHRCKRLFWLCAPSADDDETDPPNAEDGDSGISLYAMAGVRLPGSETMQLHITINGKRLVALLDSGSTHNFINADVAIDPNMLLSPCHGLRVCVANGDHLECSGVARNVMFLVGNEAFSSDFFVIPLDTFDSVLGIQWLQSLGSDYMGLHQVATNSHARWLPDHLAWHRRPHRQAA